MIDVQKTQDDAILVLESLLKAAKNGEVCQIYAVAMSHDGNVSPSYSGCWHDLALASSVLSVEFNKHYFNNGL